MKQLINRKKKKTLSSGTMKELLGVSLILLSLSIVVVADECREKERELALHGKCNHYSSNICRDMCTGIAILPENCTEKEHCCLNSNNSCVLRQAISKSQSTDAKPELMRFLLTNFLDNFVQPSAGASSGNYSSNASDDDDTESRNFQLGAGGYPPIFSGNANPTTFCPKFPQNCPFELIQNEDLSAPVNIPYCQRIACSPSNPFLDSDFKACVSQPGCYFDQELSAYRNLVGHAILPQVPVCHMVIRNRAFQKRAYKIMQKNGGAWNPLLTQCLLREYDEEIFGNAVGCQLLDFLEYFGHRAKLAGWSSINKRECLFIGGCWRSTDSVSYCAYPVNSLGQPTVRSSNDKQESRWGNKDVYGQPICSPFNPTALKEDFLSSYHTCLTAGCAIGVGRSAVWEQLIKVGSHLPYPNNAHYIAMVYSGEIRPDNYQTVMRPLQSFPLSSFLETKYSSADFMNIIPQLLLNRRFNNSRLFQFPSSLGNLGNTGKPNVNDFSDLFQSLSGGEGSRLPFTSDSGAIGNGQMPFYTGFLNPTTYNPCPYQQQHLAYPGLPVLSGSFEGCCEKPLCYMPKSELFTPYSGISSYLYHWSRWSECSKSCGGGLKNRTRICVGNHCDSNTILLQTQICNEEMCPYFLNWGDWSDCSASCGGGYKMRTRECEGSGFCIGESGESELCQTGKCPTYEFGQWSTCSNSCGRGIRTRSRFCVSHGAYGCLPDITEDGPCEQFCGSSSIRCDLTSCCYEQTCLRADGSPGYCETDNRDGLPCRTGFCWFKQNQHCRRSYSASSFSSMGLVI